jgi:PAS domain S-box-containing protein
MLQKPNDHINTDLFKSIVKQSPVSIVITDVDGIIEYVNPKFCELTGYSSDEVLGKTPRLLKSGQTSSEDYRQLWQTITLGHEWHGEFINRKKNGEIYYESAVIAPSVDESGKVSHYIGIKEDVTGRVLAQRATMEHSNRLAALLEVGQSFSSTIDMDELLRIVISKGMGLLNMDSGSIFFIIGDKMAKEASLPQPKEGEPDMLKLVSLSKFPHINACADSNEVVILQDLSKEALTPEERLIVKIKNAQSIIIIPLIIDNKVLGVMELVSSKAIVSFNQLDVEVCQVLAAQASLALKNAWLYKEADGYAEELEKNNAQLSSLNEDLLKEKNKAEEGERLKTAFLQNMSHEIRTPMNGILGFVELLKQSHLSELKQQEYLGHVVHSTNQLLTIVDDILDISRLEAGDVIIRREIVDPAVIVEAIYEKYVSRCVAGVELFVEAPAIAADKILYNEAMRLTQVLQKLVDNAIKFTRQGEVRFGYKQVSGDKILFFVEDTGIGVDADKIPLIFKPFYQVDMESNREFGGNGLGLTIATRIVESMGSFIRVETKAGMGSYFSFDLVLSDSDVLEPSPDKKFMNGRLKETFFILVAEDDEVNFLFLHDALKNSEAGERFEILHAWNGLEALDLHRKHDDLDLVLMDIKMPRMDGLEAIRIIKDENPFVPIVAQTAFALTGEQDKALEAGCEDYLSKPIDLDQLLRTVYKHLELPLKGVTYH